MDYKEFIQNILNTRGRFNVKGYKERHHIKPKCMGGSNDKKNLIDLTAREHFIAHRLLYEENQDNEKICYAYICMAFFNKNGKRYELTPEEYEQIKLVHSKTAKETFSSYRATHVIDIRGEKNPMYGRKQSDYCKQVNSEMRKGKSSWNKGLTKDTDPRIKKYSEAFKGREFSKEHRENLSKAMKGRPGHKHYGIVTRGSTGMHWFNDGKKQLMAFNAPEGFVQGKLSKPHAGKSIAQYTLDGKLICKYKKVQYAKEKYGARVYYALKNEPHIAYNSIWLYDNTTKK